MSSQHDGGLRAGFGLPGVVVLALVIALVVGGGTRLAAQTAPAGSHQLSAELQAITARVTEREAAARQATGKADRLAGELAALLRSHAPKARRLQLAIARLHQAPAAAGPTEAKTGTGGITASEVERREAEAQRLTADAGRLNQELATLLQARPAKEDQLQRALDRATQASAALGPTTRSKSDLEEELARAEQARKAAEQQAVAERQALKRTQERIGAAQEPLDIGRGRVAATAWEPKSTIEFVCRQGKVAFLDDQPLLDRFVAEAKQLIAEDKSPTWEKLAVRINNLKLEAAVCTIRVQAIGVGCIVQERLKYGDEWENVERMEAASSLFRGKLASLDATSTGLRFRVWNDSFETYIRAVTIAKRAGFRTYWVAYDKDEEMDSFLPQGGGGGTGVWEQSGS